MPRGFSPCSPPRPGSPLGKWNRQRMPWPYPWKRIRSRPGQPARDAWYTFRMNPEALSALGDLFGDRLRTSLEARICYSFDATGKKFLPDAVVYPVNAEEVRRTVVLANRHRFPVVPRGAGSGFSRGPLPGPRRGGPSAGRGGRGRPGPRARVGSGGPRGIVRRAASRLTPRPEWAATLLALFDGNRRSAEAVNAIVAARVTPSAMELMDRTALDCVQALMPVAL